MPGRVRGAPVQARQEQLGAHEEAPAGRIGGVLVGGDDVRALLEQEPGDRRDDPRPVRAANQQTRRIARLIISIGGTTRG